MLVLDRDECTYKVPFTICNVIAHLIHIFLLVEWEFVTNPTDWFIQHRNIVPGSRIDNHRNWLINGCHHIRWSSLHHWPDHFCSNSVSNSGLVIRVHSKARQYEDICETRWKAWIHTGYIVTVRRERRHFLFVLTLYLSCFIHHYCSIVRVLFT